MVVCASCGHENADDARFCSQCATPLAVPEVARESRKVVTIVFCDLVGSTALGESTDPEALRSRMRRYFEDLRTIIERHGGAVEPTRSQKRMVTTLRDSRAGSVGSSGVPHALQKRASSAFSRPQLGHSAMRGV